MMQGSSICTFADFNKKASFGLDQPRGKRQFGALHASAEMVNLDNESLKRCAQDGCQVVPVFDAKGS